MLNLPAHFIQTITGTFGADGMEWLARLPQVIDQYARRWSLVVYPAFPELSYHYVAPALAADGREVVLKLGVPGPELVNECAALRLYDGQGAAALIEADPEGGALLIERLRPGRMLVELGDDQKMTGITAQIMRQLWRPAPPVHLFPTLADWARGLERLHRRFDGGTGPLPEKLVAHAEDLFADLIASTGQPVVLHGDLHHTNILSATRQPWLAIDPKGITGDPAADPACYLRNPPGWVARASQPEKFLTRRVDQFAAELPVDRARIIGWGVALAVLSAWWSIEDQRKGWQEAVKIADLLIAIA